MSVAIFLLSICVGWVVGEEILPVLVGRRHSTPVCEPKLDLPFPLSESSRWGLLFCRMATGEGTEESPILLCDSPNRSPVKVVPRSEYR